MARDIGPDMLRDLDDRLATGEIDQASYDAQRTQALELIRTGRAVELSGMDRAMVIGGGIVALVIGLVIAGITASNQATVGVLLGLVAIVAGCVGIVKGLRARP